MLFVTSLQHCWSIVLGSVIEAADPQEGQSRMAQASYRILLVDSSVPRGQTLCGTLAKAGWEIWPGRNVQDGLVLAAGLSFQLVLAHETSIHQHPELWAQLADALPVACWLVYGETRTARRQNGAGILGSDPGLILSVLMLLLEAHPISRAQAA